MIEQLISILAVTGIDKKTILDKYPGAKDFIDDDDFEKMALFGNLTSIGTAMAIRRNFDNLLDMGFGRDEAVKIIAGGAMNAKVS